MEDLSWKLQTRISKRGLFGNTAAQEDDILNPRCFRATRCSVQTVDKTSNGAQILGC